MTDLEWQALTSAALVGTARRPVPAVASGIPVRADAAAETQLLDRAALVGAALRAGRQPSLLPAPEVAPPDEAREPTALQGQLLTVAVLQSPAGARMRTQLLVHWCEHAAKAGVHAPAGLLPDLLERATADPSLRPALRTVLDRRGQWLATQNPAWAWAAVEDAAASPLESDWEHLPSRQRPEFLKGLRATDPGTARELLNSAWAAESAKDRTVLIGCLFTGLSLDDEPFLERALDDKAGGVRQEAANLLDRLPGSARAARMRARLAPLVRQHGMLRKTIDVELPGDPDPAAVRDGLGKAPPGHSQREWWLFQLIVGTPLSFWSELSGADPPTIVSRIHQDEVMHALVWATLAQHDPIWALVLFRHAQRAELRALVSVLPDPILQKRAVHVLPRTDLAELRMLLEVLPSYGPELSRQLVPALSRPMPSPRFLFLQPELLARLHPDCLPDLLALSRRTDLAQHERTIVADLIQLFSVQQSLSEAFT